MSHTRKLYFEELQPVDKDDTVMHTIIIEYDYKQIVSLNAFSNRMVQEYLRCRDLDDAVGRAKANWDRRMEYGRNQHVERGLEEIAHYSVWEFYDYIGYDYKKSTSRKVVWK